MDATLRLSCAIHTIGMMLEKQYPTRGLITDDGYGFARLYHPEGEGHIVVASYDADYTDMPNFTYSGKGNNNFPYHGGVSVWWRQSASRITRVEWDPRRTCIPDIVEFAFDAIKSGNAEWTE